MSAKLYVGNLSYNTQQNDLVDLFGQYGEVMSANIIVDRDTNQSKGFGFIEMASADEAQACISAINGSDLDGRQLKVNEAKERAPRRNNY
jgi:RNA recognition motif-containing protein